MASERPEYVGGASWSVDDIPYHALVHSEIRDDRRLFNIVASASFIEITSDLYTRNLIEFFQGDDEVVEWLTNGWEKEELQHGAALKRYVQTAWPEFDWETGYRCFMGEYARICTVEALAGTRALEMASRCVVETGTATFYRMLAELSPEPVLKRIASEISADEVRHYKHFYRYFLRYRDLEQPSRVAILQALLKRAREVETLDAYCSFKGVCLGRDPNAPFSRDDFDTYRDEVAQLLARHYRFEMAAKMLIKPLGLHPTITRAMLPAVTSATRLYAKSGVGRITRKGRTSQGSA
jgi:hypothetical protein